MAHRIRTWWARPRDESSNSFALFFIMMPVIMGAFGLGLDMSRNVYIRTTLQNALDMATVAGAGVSDIDTRGRVVISKTKALNTVEQVYALNRADAAPADCWGDKRTIPASTYKRCWRVVGTPTVSTTHIKYTVRERTKNAFLPVVGIKWQRYTIVSQSRVTQDAE